MQKKTTKVPTSFRIMGFELDRARKNAAKLGIKFTEYIELAIHDKNEAEECHDRKTCNRRSASK